MATPTSGAFLVARSEPRTRTALLLESIALRHQITVLERSELLARVFGVLIGCLDLAVVLVAAMARKPGDRPAGNRLALAS